MLADLRAQVAYGVLASLYFQAILGKESVIADSAFKQDDRPIVKVSEGWLQGRILNLATNDGTYYSFKGIPYAAPPLGELRFKAPQAALPWEGIRDASEHGSECYQFDIVTDRVVNGSEDCLFLNVYTQALNPNQLMPVMVFIHGGAFITGSGNSGLYGPDLLVKKGVVLVTINYRLEVLGFLSLENENIPGNAGMKDQVAALRWVQKNIINFGGDPLKVTIFGESAGAASVGLHLLSPLSSGLFKRAILQSGSPACEWAWSEFPKETAFNLGKSLGIVTDSSDELEKCLRAIPKEKLVNRDIKVTPWDLLTNLGRRYTYAPVTELPCKGCDNFLTMSPSEYLSRGIINDADVMTGYTSEEWIFFSQYLKSEYALANTFLEFFLPRTFAYNLTVPKALELGSKIKKHYLGNKVATKETNLELVRFHSWLSFKYPVVDFLKSLPESIEHKRYLYYFSAMTERNVFGPLKGADGVSDKGVSHADDLPYMFHQPLVGTGTDRNTEGFEIIDQVTDMWTNFAKYGNPTPVDTVGVIWKPYSKETEEYLNIGNKLTTGSKLDADEVAFWEDVYALGRFYSRNS